MTNLIQRISLILLVLSIGMGTTARNKKLPLLEDYKSYNLRKNKVAKVTYRVYTDEEKKNMIDFIPEFFFDEKGNLEKVVVFDMDNNIEATTNWEYDIKAGTFNEFRRDSLNEQTRKKLSTIYSKEKKVSIKTYEKWFDEFAEVVHFEVLMEESKWRDRKKDIEEEKIFYSPQDSSIIRKSTRKYGVRKGENMFDVIHRSNIDSDYIWLPIYMEDTQKADKKATRTEVLQDGAKFTYALKKGLLYEKKDFDKAGVLKNHTTYTYEYDKNKNWIKLIQKENEQIRYVVFREIEYR